MKDKEKQISKNKEINDLANTLYNRQDKYDLSNPFEVAKCVIDLGYLKIDKDSVVLTREELQELKKYKTDWLNSEKMHLQGELEYTEFELSCTNEMYSTLSKLYDEAEEKLKKYNEFNNNLIVENQKIKDELIIARKETAEKIYNFVERYIMDDAEVELMVKKWFKKQFGVEIKE